MSFEGLDLSFEGLDLSVGCFELSVGCLALSFECLDLSVRCLILLVGCLDLSFGAWICLLERQGLDRLADQVGCGQWLATTLAFMLVIGTAALAADLIRLS